MAPAAGRPFVAAPDPIARQATWTDPAVFIKSWTAQPDRRRDEKYGIFEYACHEGDEQIRTYITSSRAERASKQK